MCSGFNKSHLHKKNINNGKCEPLFEVDFVFGASIMNLIWVLVLAITLAFYKKWET